MNQQDEAIQTLLQRAKRLKDAVEAYKTDLERAKEDSTRAIKGIEDSAVALASVEQAIKILEKTR